MRGAPGLVTLHLWGVPRRHIPWAFSRMAVQPRRLRQLSTANPAQRVPGLRFARLLGTGRGRSFTPTDADPRHWALLASWDGPAEAAAFERNPLVTGWDDHGDERWRLRLRPLTSTGQWSGLQPFGPTVTHPDPPAGPCAILTRARLVPHQMIAFRRAVPAVAAALPGAAGLRFARGIGEAPVGLQATFSVWDNLDAATDFAYGCAAHLRVMERTAKTRWYAEQLFARFAVIDAKGCVDGRNPLGDRSGTGGRVG